MDKTLIHKLGMIRKKYPEPVFMDTIKYMIAKETIKQIENTSSTLNEVISKSVLKERIDAIPIDKNYMPQWAIGTISDLLLADCVEDTISAPRGCRKRFTIKGVPIISALYLLEI